MNREKNMESLNFPSKYMKILDSIRYHLPEGRYESVRDLLCHNEGVIGLDIMIDNIEELEIPISEATFSYITDCLEEAEMDVSLSQNVRSLIDPRLA